MCEVVDSDKLIDLDIPKTLEDALKIARSLVSWIDYIKTNPDHVRDPLASFGGHIDFHLVTLNAWFAMEKVNVSLRELRQLVGE